MIRALLAALGSLAVIMAAAAADLTTVVQPTPITGTAVARDGDTLTIDGTDIDLFGVDAPEMQNPPWGLYSRTQLEAILAIGGVTCLREDMSSQDRLVAICRDARGRDIGSLMVRAGWASAHRRGTTTYDRDEQAARDAGRGIWQDWAATMRFNTWPAWDIPVGIAAVVAGLLGFGGLIVVSWRVIVHERKRAEARQDSDALAVARLLTGVLTAYGGVIQHIIDEIEKARNENCDTATFPVYMFPTPHDDAFLSAHLLSLAAKAPRMVLWLQDTHTKYRVRLEHTLTGIPQMAPPNRRQWVALGHPKAIPAGAVTIGRGPLLIGLVWR